MGIRKKRTTVDELTANEFEDEASSLVVPASSQAVVPASSQAVVPTSARSLPLPREFRHMMSCLDGNEPLTEFEEQQIGEYLPRFFGPTATHGAKARRSWAAAF